jgi:uncharacterized radical SAM superfamily Fe-S cluster-containing enzyme
MAAANEYLPTVDKLSGREEYQYISTTRSTCFECFNQYPEEIRLVDAEIYAKNNKVYMKKFCPEHGHSYALKCSDAQWYMNKARQMDKLRPGVPAGAFQTEVSKGCPYDCGLCPDHHQHTCVPVIDITGKCDMACPACDAQVARKSPYFMSKEEFTGILDMAILSNQEVQAVALSGGDPSLHPQLFEFIEIALERDPIRRVDFLTGGKRIAEDERFVERIARYNPNIYVNLSFDGLTAAPYEYIRGRDYLDLKLRALENLKTYEINTITQTVVAKGKNDDQLGRIILELVREPHIRGFIFQPLIWARGAREDIIDPVDRTTVTDILEAFANQTDGLLTKDDFIPSPCPHPECQLMGYLWVGKRIKSLRRVIPEKELLDLIQSEPLLRPERIAEVLLNRARFFVSGADKRDRDKLAEWERHNKFINIHHYMDPFDFDLSRLRKCCQHMPVPKPDQRLVPVCLYNMFFRHQDRRWVL